MERLQQLIQATSIGFISGITAITPAQSAEDIYFNFGVFERGIPTDSLATFAADGTVDSELAPYIARFPEERQQELREILGTPLSEIAAQLPGQGELIGNPYGISQLLYSPMGESVLTSLGEIIKTQGRQNGKLAIRAAIILAAADPEGLSLINIIRFFPTDVLRIDLAEVLALSKAIDVNIEATERFLEIAAQQSQAEAAAAPTLDYTALPVLAETPQFNVVQVSLMLEDSIRDRTYPADLYMPENLDAVQGPIPVIVFSHGYGDSRTNPEFVLAARSVAAHGFVVAMPEHIGSNNAYQADLIKGLNDDSFAAMEFVDRPLDIRFLLDTLEQMNSTQFQGRLQLDRVGVIVLSFGGYTALVTAGARVDLEYLREPAICDPAADIEPDNLNLSLLLACRVLELEASPDVINQLTDGSLADDRVGLVMAFDPVSSLFGDEGTGQIQIPTFMLGSSLDVAAPIVLEQLTTFERLQTPQKYFYVGDNLSHTTALTKLMWNLVNPNSTVEADFDSADAWLSSIAFSLVIAHGKVHLLEDESYLPYLTSAYVEAVTKPPFKLHLLRSLPDEL